MTADLVNELLNAPEVPPSVKRDRWNRYVLPDPETAEIIPWTRATTICDVLEDRYNLEKWMQRNIVYGIGRREDLFAKAASVSSIDEKDTLSKVVEEAFEAAASSGKANLGTALHRFAERVDNGEKLEVPTFWRADIAAYRSEMAAHNIEMVPGWSERILIVPEIQTAGTTDRLLQAPTWTLPRIGDLKTGAEVDERYMSKIAGQLAIYANASHWWDPVAKCYHEMPPVDHKIGLVMHVPVGKGECHLWEIDIEAGWNAVRNIAVELRSYRKRKDLAWPLVSATAPVVAETPAAELPADEPLAPVETFDDMAMLEKRREWLRNRVVGLVKEHNLAQDVADMWNQTCPEIPTFKKGGPITNAEIDRVAGVCSLVEMTHQLPFGDPDPAKQKPNPYVQKELLPA